MAPDDHRPPGLYEEDFYRWTQVQAEALRARGQGATRIDYDVLAEEVEDLGKRERREAMSRTATIIEHLFKLAWSSRSGPRGGWEATILSQRADLRQVLTPSLRRDVEAEIEALHDRAASVASRVFKGEEPDVACDASLRWSLAQILGEADDPIA